MKRKSILLLVAVIAAKVLVAQDRALPFLEMNPDVRTLGMGNAYMGHSDQGYLYTNPTSMFQLDSKFAGSYSVGYLPTIDKNRQFFHAAALGAKVADNHLLSVGFRYLGGLEVQQTDENGAHRAFYPKDFSIDVAYAMQFNQHFSAYLSGGYVRSYIGKNANLPIWGAGAYYNDEAQSCPIRYSLGAEVRNLGGKFRYGKDGSLNNLPTSVAIGGNSMYTFNDKHKVNLALMGLYYAHPSYSQKYEGRLGLEYIALEKISLRSGYNFRGANSCFTVGLGYKISCLSVNVGYMVNLSKNNYTALGVNF